MARSVNEYDYIIVGAGVAGSVLAARLSEGNARVLLLEAGSGSPPPNGSVPQAWPMLSTTTWNWGESSTPQFHTTRSVPVPRGRGVGGSSLINAMIFMRGHRANYDAWEHMGAKGWGFDDLLPYFKRSETASGHDPTVRGTDGPIIVAPADPPNEVLSACLTAAVESGYRRATDISSGLEVGFGPVDLNIIWGRRQSAADAYLWPSVGRINLDLITNVVVRQLLFEGNRCVGIEYGASVGDDVAVAHADEVILTAGTIGSPQLLMESGIGPQSHLRAVGIDPRLDLPGVGTNLQDHAWVMVAYRAARSIPPAQHNHGEITGLIRSGPGEAPDLQLVFGDSAGPEFVGFEGVENGYVIAVCMVQPYSRGTVRLAGRHGSLRIDPNYFSDDRDMQTMIRGVRIAREIGMAHALDEWRAEEVSPGPAADDDAALRAFINANFGSYTHLVGTCAMGDTNLSVVDEHLRVHGVRGLRVADASVIPTVPSTNTAATVYAVAERAADMILTGSDMQCSKDLRQSGSRGDTEL
jgi:choline dehydrogenase